MRTSHQTSKLFLGASLAILAGLHSAVGAGFPFTAPGPGVQWYISDNMLPNPSTSPPNGGLALSDADFNAVGQGLDAYDGAFAIKINTVPITSLNTPYFVAPPTASLNAGIFDSGLVAGGAYNVQVRYRFMQNLPIVRAVYTFTSTAATTLYVNWDDNLGSDANTTVRATSSSTNPAPLALADRWFVSHDNGANGDLINTIVRWGPNAPQSPESGSILLNTPEKDLLSDKYTLSFTAAGQTKQLMMFGVLSALNGNLANSATGARDFADIFNNPQAMLAQGYFDGMDTQNVVNWGVIPEPGVLSLLGVGLGILAFRARRRWSPGRG